ncbi:kinase-like protein [Guyanagaster necrorhizus]|uniref:Kinase-like protein n=1 Tax=Guyanagaster necrorhizus TaxID=856835 RepID=A0A9P7VTX4_9AGAR|nr:kinase-like protein [Guyanagaster necrorhizus MCA 3950]KAG7446502.1 kinase-like protein [Guyanagaster necrorhizus MCA 3950]
MCPHSPLDISRLPLSPNELSLSFGSSTTAINSSSHFPTYHECLSSSPEHSHHHIVKSPFSLSLDADRYSSHFPPDHQLDLDFVRTFQLEDELGAGGYGFVMTARHRWEGYEVAVKFIIKEKVPGYAWVQDDRYGRLPTEVFLLNYMDHRNIVKGLDLFQDPSYFYLVQELHGSPWSNATRAKRANRASCPGSSPISTPSLTPSRSADSLNSDPAPSPPMVSPYHQLSSYLPVPLKMWKKNSQPTLQPQYSRRPSHDLFECIDQSEHKRLSEEQARYIFAQVVDAVHYLDSHGISHRDIKDENIAIDKDLHVKLIDFGSAIAIDPTKSRPYYKFFHGTTAYAAAEILLKKPYQAAPAEVWTLGVLLSYLLHGMSPFRTKNDAIKGRIVLNEYPALSRSAWDLLRKCLDPNPKTRATIREVKIHRWLNQ